MDIIQAHKGDTANHSLSENLDERIYPSQEKPSDADFMPSEIIPMESNIRKVTPTDTIESEDWNILDNKIIEIGEKIAEENFFSHPFNFDCVNLVYYLQKIDKQPEFFNARD
jgi:hypothetical protein